MKEHVAVRLDGSEIEKLDAVAAHISTSWYTATRSDAMRAVVGRGIAAFEQEMRGAAAHVAVVHSEAPTNLRPRRNGLGPRRSTLAEDVKLKADAKAALDQILKEKGI